MYETLEGPSHPAKRGRSPLPVSIAIEILGSKSEIGRKRLTHRMTPIVSDARGCRWFCWRPSVRWMQFAQNEE